MISISKYLYGAGWRGPQDKKNASDNAALPELYRLADGLLEAINQHVLTGDRAEPLRTQVGEVQQALRAGLAAGQGTLVEGAVSEILGQYRVSAQQAAVNQAVEVQHIFAMLNQALIFLAEGKERSVSRLNQIQESLRRSSQIQDIVALKTALAETVRFVREESVHARELGGEELNRLEAEVNKAREFMVNTKVELAGRSEGVSRISEWTDNLPPGQAVYVVAYLCDRLHAITQRYGAAVGEEVMFRVIKERIQPVAAADATYRWTGSSLVGVLRRPRDLQSLEAQVASLNRSPVVHRIALGNRTAVLTVSPSHLVAEGSEGGAAALVEQLDRFATVH